MQDKLPTCGHTQLREGCNACLSFQEYWYSKIEGYKDAEEKEIAYGFYEPSELQPIVPRFYHQENFLNHPEFPWICKKICRHGNHKLDKGTIAKIWEAYSQGMTYRPIAANLGIKFSSVQRTVRDLTKWMQLMDLDKEDEPKSVSRVVIRRFSQSQDEAFIYATWRNQLWYDDESKANTEPTTDFKIKSTDSISKILSNPQTKVRIAGLSDGSDYIVGYSIVTGNCLHFVYVKADYRNKRIGSLLVPRSVETVSPVMTKIGRCIALKRGYIKEKVDG